MLIRVEKVTSVDRLSNVIGPSWKLLNVWTSNIAISQATAAIEPISDSGAVPGEGVSF